MKSQNLKKNCEEKNPTFSKLETFKSLWMYPSYTPSLLKGKVSLAA